MAIQSAKGDNPERHYRFIVEFGLHTFTLKPNAHTGQTLSEDDVPIEYEVYFNVAREKDGILKLFVESAYVRDNTHASSQPKKKKINFFVIAYNTFQGKQIKIPPG